MRVLVLERVLANAIMLGQRTWANAWLLPVPSLHGQRIGLRAESQDDGWWWWFYTSQAGLKLPPLSALRRGDLGTVELVGVAEPGEFGRSSHGPAVWVFRSPQVEGLRGTREMRVGYSDQPHVIERDKLALGREAQEGKTSEIPGSVRAVPEAR
jgi:hypothetical protein